MIKVARMDPAARDVLNEYAPAVGLGAWKPLGNAGGFSGARIWRGELADGRSLCLRAWPLGRTQEDHLRLIHEAQNCCDLPFISRLWRTRDGGTFVRRGKQFWEVSDWMPGHAGFHLQPSDERLFAAMRALAAIHERLQAREQREGPCPAVCRIIAAFRAWRELVQSGWKPNFGLDYPYEIHERGRRAWNVLLGGALTAEYSLLDWTERPVPIQLCLCDVWHDHILYTDNEVTGVIDFGSVKMDCVAMDLARLLGSFIPDEGARMNRALAVWSALRPVPRAVLDLVPVLDRAGMAVGLTNWVRWIYMDERPFSDERQVVRRMDALLRRAESKRPTALLPWAM
jgi:thiamine kinase-like enzyme